MVRYYNIAHGTKPTGSGFPWPYDIYLCFDAVSEPIMFIEGVEQGTVGCTLTAEVALDSKWAEYFQITNALWLVPYIRRLAEGTPFPQEEILNHYEKIHGQPPSNFESSLS